VREGLRGAIAALSFLTAVPVGRRAAIVDADLRRGTALFPLIGAVVGALTALVGWGTSLLLPSVPAAVFAVAAGVVMTGAMHLDGLADTADGVGAALAGRDPIQVMADPRLGTFGGAALVLDLVLKISVLAALIGEGRFPWAVVAAGALGRGSVLGLSIALRYSGPPDGAGVWVNPPARGRSLAGLAVCAVIGAASAGPRFVPMLAVATIVCGLIGRWSSRHLAGMRGDTFGAAVELTETLAMAVALAAR